MMTNGKPANRTNIVPIFLDNNVWDFLLEREIQLDLALPREYFRLCITRQAEFEIKAIPAEKSNLREYISDMRKKCEIRTDAYFGFANPSIPSNEQRVGGFGFGRFISTHEAAMLRKQTVTIKKFKRKTKLYSNEADVALAVRSCIAVVLTNDRKKGPLLKSYKAGGKVVFLNDFDDMHMPLSEYITTKLACIWTNLLRNSWIRKDR